MRGANTSAMAETAHQQPLADVLHVAPAEDRARQSEGIGMLRQAEPARQRGMHEVTCHVVTRQALAEHRKALPQPAHATAANAHTAVGVADIP